MNTGQRIDTPYGTLEIISVDGDVVGLGLLKEGFGPSPAQFKDIGACFSVSSKECAAIISDPSLLVLR